MKKFKLFISLILLVFISSFALNTKAYSSDEAEALLLMPEEDMEDYQSFSRELESGGARILEAYSTNIFRGYIPKNLEVKLQKKYGAKIFRQRVEYMGDFAAFGEKGMLAAAKWNKYLQEEPTNAPLIINMTAKKLGRGGKYLKLCWNEVPDAVLYKLQISKNESFDLLSFKTATKATCHTIMPDFWQDGVHYWRVAPVFKTVRKETEDGDFSSPANFAVAKNVSPNKKTKPKKPVLPEKMTAWKNVSWEPCQQPYYRLQLSESKKFDVPYADIFTDSCSCRASLLRMKKGKTYYFRIMSSDGSQSSSW
ncbi:MAG: hypothetical protein J5706_08155, partial [Elusimicrobiales bacterium]|nr:hypothetical protein [Elusimicrobiales bacterium]